MQTQHGPKQHFCEHNQIYEGSVVLFIDSKCDEQLNNHSISCQEVKLCCGQGSLQEF